MVCSEFVTLVPFDFPVSADQSRIAPLWWATDLDPGFGHFPHLSQANSQGGLVL